MQQKTRRRRWPELSSSVGPVVLQLCGHAIGHGAQQQHVEGTGKVTSRQTEAVMLKLAGIEKIEAAICCQCTWACGSYVAMPLGH
jgi:hypothetical protein